ncbi:MAG: glycosyltransferase [Candidatus Omnitrophota bacterium]
MDKKIPKEFFYQERNIFMPAKISDYEDIVGKSAIYELKILAERLKGKVVQNINSTAVGGGVAEILNRMIPLLREIGVDARWDLIKGGEKFFQITKKFHNALHGKSEEITEEMFSAFLDNSARNIKEVSIYGDIIMIHDPQPVVLVEKRKEKDNKWIWRCHIDVSNPDSRVWKFVKQYVNKYDAAVFSNPNFAQLLEIRQFLVAPSIDPLSDKNIELPQEKIDAVLKKYEIDKDIPIITQVSRFDYLKDPVGVIEVFNLVRKYKKSQLVLAGGTATDDPESYTVLEEVREKAKGNPDIHILAMPPGSDIEINALQRASTVILQKSIREGFGLTVTEALWKAKPVIASAVGGIPQQIKHKYSGLLSYTIEGTAHFLKQLLHSPDYAKKLGQNGHEHIKQNFLLTRHLKEYMLLYLALYHDADVINI